MRSKLLSELLKESVQRVADIKSKLSCIPRVDRRMTKDEFRDLSLELRFYEGRIEAIQQAHEAEVTASYREVDRLRTALLTIAAWDCLNPPRPELLSDLPWLHALVHEALGTTPPKPEGT